MCEVAKAGPLLDAAVAAEKGSAGPVPLDLPAAADAVPTPVEPGAQSVEATVTVSFSLA